MTGSGCFVKYGLNYGPGRNTARRLRPRGYWGLVSGLCRTTRPPRGEPIHGVRVVRQIPLVVSASGAEAASKSATGPVDAGLVSDGLVGAGLGRV
jgi:hypothetical protein